MPPNLSDALLEPAGVPWGPWLCMAGSPPIELPLFGGKGFILGSLRVDVDDEGVRLGDWVSRPALDEGEAVPSFGSLFFLDDLLSPLPRDSCEETTLASVLCGSSHTNCTGCPAINACTYDPLAEALHFCRSQPTRSRRGRTPKATALLGERWDRNPSWGVTVLTEVVKLVVRSQPQQNRRRDNKGEDDMGQSRRSTVVFIISQLIFRCGASKATMAGAQGSVFCISAIDKQQIAADSTKSRRNHRRYGLHISACDS